MWPTYDEQIHKPGFLSNTALYLSDVLCTSYHTVKITKVHKGETVAIWGMGPIGVMVAFFAFREGAKRVIGIDNNVSRLRYARLSHSHVVTVQWRLGWAKSKVRGLETLDYTKLSKGQSVVSKLHELVPGGVDVCLDCAAGEYAKSWLHYLEMAVYLETDTSETVNEMITSTRAWGRCGLTGVYTGFTNHLNIGSLMQRGVALIGCGQAPCHRCKCETFPFETRGCSCELGIIDWHELLEMIARGELDPSIMVTHRFSLSDADKVYPLFDKRDEKDGIQKVFLETRFSAPAAAGTPELFVL